MIITMLGFFVGVCALAVPLKTSGSVIIAAARCLALIIAKLLLPGLLLKQINLETKSLSFWSRGRPNGERRHGVVTRTRDGDEIRLQLRISMALIKIAHIREFSDPIRLDVERHSRTVLLSGDAPEADMTHGRVDRLRMARGRPVAPAVVGRA
jgi:hypothetical protein